jgi:hypothetical protein
MLLKKVLVLAIFICTALIGKAQPGKYAGKQKDLINLVYTNSRNIPGLAGWTFVEGSVVSPLSDSVMITVDVFKKGTTIIVFFSTCKDSIPQEFTIADVLEITPVTKGWIVETAFCQLDNFDNPWIVGWAKVTSSEYLKIIKKAWRFNPEKKEIEQVPVKGIACLNENFDID